MLALVLLGLGFLNGVLLIRLWRNGRARRKTLGDKLDALTPLARPRRPRHRDQA